MRETLLLASEQTFRCYDASSGTVLCQSGEEFPGTRGRLLRSGLYFVPHVTKPLITCWRVGAPEQPWNRLVLPDVPVAFDVSESASWMIAAFKGGRLMAWDTRTGNIMKSFSVCLEMPGEITSVRISPQEHAVVLTVGHYCAVYNMLEFIRLLDVTTEKLESVPQPLLSYRCPDPITAVDMFFPDDTYRPLICLGDDKGRMYCWDCAECAEPLWICELHAPITSVTINDSADAVLLTCTHPQIMILELDLGRCKLIAPGGPIIWERDGVNWPWDTVPNPKDKTLDTSTRPEITQIQLGCMQRTLVTVTDCGVLLWSVGNRAVTRILNAGTVTDVGFVLAPAGPPISTDEPYPMGVPLAPSNSPKVPLRLSLAANDTSGFVVIPQKGSDEKLFNWLLELLPRESEDSWHEVAPETSVALKNLWVHEMACEDHKARVDAHEDRCKAALTSLDALQARKREEYQAEPVVEGNAHKLFRSVNPVLGGPPAQPTAPESGYFVPPTWWQPPEE